MARQRVPLFSTETPFATRCACPEPLMGAAKISEMHDRAADTRSGNHDIRTAIVHVVDAVAASADVIARSSGPDLKMGPRWTTRPHRGATIIGDRNLHRNDENTHKSSWTVKSLNVGHNTRIRPFPGACARFGGQRTRVPCSFMFSFAEAVCFRLIGELSSPRPSLGSGPETLRQAGFLLSTTDK
jgi:hypothetical protein